LEDFGDLLTQTVTRKTVTGRDNYGQPSWSGAATLPCRVVHKTKLVRSTASARSETEGAVREVVSTAQVWTAHVGWSVEDQITLPDGTKPVILHVDSYPDEAGDHHQVVYL
jgi:hypothetical protein